jgi:hypothetical protein
MVSYNGLAESLFRTRSVMLMLPSVSLNSFSLLHICSANRAILSGKSPFSREADLTNWMVLEYRVDPRSWSTKGANGPFNIRIISDIPVSAATM